MNKIPQIEKDSIHIKTLVGLNALVRVNHLLSMLKDPLIDDTDNIDFLYYNEGYNRWEVRRQVKYESNQSVKQKLVEVIKKFKAEAVSAKAILAKPSKNYPIGYMQACDEILDSVEKIFPEEK